MTSPYRQQDLSQCKTCGRQSLVVDAWGDCETCAARRVARSIAPILAQDDETETCRACGRTQTTVNRSGLCARCATLVRSGRSSWLALLVVGGMVIVMMGLFILVGYCISM